MLILALAAQLATTTLDLSTAKVATVVAVQPVEADGDPATAEWLLRSADDTYRIGRSGDTPCLSEPFHPDGLAPTFAPKRILPIQRVGSRDAFVAFDPAAQTLTIYALPSGCQP